MYVPTIGSESDRNKEAGVTSTRCTNCDICSPLRCSLYLPYHTTFLCEILSQTENSKKVGNSEVSYHYHVGS